MNTKLNKLRALGLAALALLTLPQTALADTPQMFGMNITGGENPFVVPNDPYPTAYYYPGDADLDYYKSKGITLLRIPFRWERLQPSVNGILDPDEVQRWNELFDRIEKRGMRVIPDMHSYGKRRLVKDQSATAYPIGDPNVPVAAFYDVWNKLAAVWKDRGCIWAYGIMNEPNTDSYSWFTAAQAAVDAIRAHDMNTAILIPGDKGSSANAWTLYSANLINIVDPANDIIYEAHQYFDNGRDGDYAHNTYEGEGATPTTGSTTIANFVNWCIANNVRGFLGEYGIPVREQDDFTYDTRWDTVLDGALSTLQANGMSGTYWAGGAAYAARTTARLRGNSDNAGFWPLLTSYADGAGTNHFPKFSWYHNSVALGEFGSYAYNFVSPGGTLAFDTAYTAVTYNGSSRAMRFNFTIPSGGWGGGGLHLADNTTPPKSGAWNLPDHLTAGHVLSFYARGSAGTSLTVKLGSASINSVGVSTGALTGTWTRYEIPLTSFLNASVTATTKVPRVMFDVYPRNNVASEINIDLLEVGPPASNTAPTVSVDTSTGASTYGIGQTVPLVATATDTGGSIDYVEFHANNQRIGIDDTAPYQLNTSFATAGTYAITATTYDNFGVPAESAVKTLTITAGPPAAPAGLVATPGNARVLLSWTATSGATSYNVKRATVSGGPYTTVSSPTTNSWTDTGRTNNTTYYYVVSAVNGAGQSVNSSQVSATPQALSIIKDNQDTSGVSFSGTWTSSTSTPGAYGGRYHVDGNTGSITPYKSVTYTPTIAVAGNYRVYARWTAGANRASNATYDITHTGGTTHTTQNQTLNNNTWMLIGTVYLNAGTSGNVIIRNNGADNNVIADAVRFDLY